MRAKDADRLSRLDEKRLIGAEPLQGRDDRVEALPVARRLAGPAVDDEVLRLLGHVRIEVVLEHPEGGFLDPSPAAERRARRGADHTGHSIDRHARSIATGDKSLS